MAPILLLLVLALVGCGSSGVTVQGTLDDSTSASEVWVLGSPERIPIVRGEFELRVERGDTVDLRFSGPDQEETRMRLEGLEGGTVRLHRVWFDEDLAFPADVSTGDDGPVLVNGLRLGGRGAIPSSVNVAATVLAVGDDGEALIVRPAEGALPDLRVVVTPASVVRTADGDPVDAVELEFGDSLRVSGLAESGYLIAAEIMVPRRVAAESGDASGDERSTGRSQEDDEGDDSRESAGGGDRRKDRDKDQEKNRGKKRD